MRRAAFLLLAAFALTGCGGTDPEPLSSAPPREVTELDNILVLRSDFEADAGKTRVLILFSPT